ncbi:murein hydrolase activator EnvC family protein [Exiguobacterium profundum]|uniref:murein hydrolase activator EnvC family protein n=1 Tax=Exiguobacterium TaxID=33986 RepID=UPI0018C35B3F|nr:MULTISPECIES: M23 family metallopeptidase [Exiguobacterium]QPI66952.1 peptidoglycan DD-metalloendopeptidase family protein [Exiguobacterium sp. PBE]MBG0916394.1 peptidoglycan DD-metalloendopeptidase family protein [Exiguobacterium sp. SRB7LM]MCT4797218.1 peptidoglycan DD-metalloendopeptidase family protein [Exiguobacterium profundum]MCV9898640.1 peptidoglycan DD-metalloendopeptidase family protein [Exiguobacterium sp. N5]MDT0190947.1 peptidoglycan DD-metalloendopeptidase family protein [Exi
MGNLKKFAATVTLGALLIGGTSPTYAASLTEKQKKVQEQRQKNSSEQSKANSSIQSREQAISKEQQEINKLDAELQDVINDVAQKKAEIRATEEKIKKLQAQIKKYEAKMKAQEDLMKDRMATMQKNGGSSVNWAEFIFGSKDFGDLITRMITAGTIQENDQQIFEEYEATKEKLAKAQADLKAERDSLVKQKEELEKRQKELDQKMKERAAKIKKLEAEKVKFESKLMSLQEMEDTLKAQEQAIQSEIEAQRRAEEEARRAAAAAAAAKKQQGSSSNSGSSASTAPVASAPASGGMFQRPASGRLSQGWGPASGANGYSFHNGLDIAGPVGTPIYAAQTGTVLRAGWGGAYGNHVMIAHVINGQVWTTVYAHMSSVSVSAGQRVSQGQNLGGMGSTGNSTGSHLHFEIHRGGYSYSSSSAGSTVNPASFF